MEKKIRVRRFKDVPRNTVFRILKEGKKTEVETGLFVKGDGLRTYAYSKAKEILLGVNDLVDVVAFPSERREKGYR